MGSNDRSSTRRLIRGERLAWQTIGDETVVVDLGRSLAYSLNQSGSVLWSQLEDATSIDELKALLGTAGGSREPATEEIASFLAELEEIGLVVETERPSDGPTRTPEVSPPAGQAPRILWREELRACVMQGSCAFGPGTACETIPPGPFGP